MIEVFLSATLVEKSLRNFDAREQEHEGRNPTVDNEQAANFVCADAEIYNTSNKSFNALYSFIITFARSLSEGGSVSMRRGLRNSNVSLT